MWDVLVLLLTIQSTTGVVVYVVLFGAGFGVVTPMRVALVAEFYGPAHYGSISGVSAFCITVAQAFGAVSAGITFDYYGSYTVPIRVLTCVSIASAVAILMAERAAITPRACTATRTV